MSRLIRRKLEETTANYLSKNLLGFIWFHDPWRVYGIEDSYKYQSYADAIIEKCKEL